MPFLANHTRRVCSFLPALAMLPKPLTAFGSDFTAMALLTNPTAPPYISNLYGRISLAVILMAVPTIFAVRFARLSRTLKRTIAANKQANDALQESEARYRATLNASPDGICVTDLEGRICTASPTTLSMFGYEREEEVTGRPFTDFIVPEDKERALSKIALMFQGVFTGPSEYRVVRADGSEFIYEVNNEFILDAEGQSFGMVFIGRDTTERKRAKMALEESNRLLEALSITDGLTGLANRRRFDDVLSQEHARHIRSKAELSMIMLDIDHFKAFNDCYGHVSGDDCLHRIARVLDSCAVRAVDLAARYGGEEFACILPETDQSGAVAIAEKIRLAIMALAIPHSTSPTATCVTASLGVVTITCTADLPVSDIIELADNMLYAAKSGGRNRVETTAVISGLIRPLPEQENNLVQLIWKDEFCSGNDQIDTQHRHLFTASDELLDAMLTNRPIDEVSALVTRLLNDIALHFHDEEAILERVNFSGLKLHAAGHSRLLAEGLILSQALESDSVPVGTVFKFLVYNVILQHMLGADREFFSIVAEASTNSQDISVSDQPEQD